MPFHNDHSIETLARRFLDCSLPKPDWTHEAHLAVALYLLEQDIGTAFAEMPSCIRAYNEATGVENTDSSGYHETITHASLCATLEVLRTAPEHAPLHVSLNTLLSGPYGQSSWLLAYWSRERLFSVEARRYWVNPDVSPLPFDTRQR